MPRQREFGAVQSIFAVTVVVFLVQMVADRFTNNGFTRVFGLGRDAFLHGYIWQFLTYQLLHGGFLHIIMNMLMLGIFGRELEENLGSVRLSLLYFGAGVLGGLCWLLVSGLRDGVPCVGASGAVFGIIGAFAGMHPHGEMSLWFFIIPPIRMTARTMALVFGLATLAMMLASDQNVAHAAHLAGGVAGYIYGTRCRRYGWAWGAAHEPWLAWLRRKVGRAEGPPLESEVNAVLDKIGKLGMDAMTGRDKAILKRSQRYGIRRE